MTIRMSTIAPLMLFCMAPAPASADIEIGPDPYAPSVNIQVREHERGHRLKPRHRVSSDPPKSGCTYNGLYIVCPMPGPAPAGAVFSPGMAQSAVENLPMPALALNVQPDGPTLVNADTIFYAEPENFSAEIELLDHTIEVRAEPVGFIWIHGDGSEQSTSNPGKPYPSREVTHRYLRPSDGVSARVDTVYEVEFSIDGDGWEELGAPLVAVGPSTSIEVEEAAPVLVRE